MTPRGFKKERHVGGRFLEQFERIAVRFREGIGQQLFISFHFSQKPGTDLLGRTQASTKTHRNDDKYKQTSHGS